MDKKRTRKLAVRTWSAFLSVFVSSLLVCCGEPVPRVKVSGGNPPTFTISRTSLIYLEIYDFEIKTPSPPLDFIWKISSKFDPDKDIKVPVEIVYGIVPEGFYQHTPKDNKQAPALIEGKKYKYEAMGSWGAKIGWFEIKDGKAVDVEYQGSIPIRQ